uniref:Exophilin 5 n=1 Tax=Panagrolaimus sp. PS1159 TaxID=55785 RepID=A0AC35GLV5_9BILA
MSTKSDKDSFIEQSFTTSENQCYNLNLNQRKKCTTLIPVQSNSKTNNVSDNYEENEKLQLWNKSSKVSNFTTHNEDNEDLKNRWKNENALKTTNKSTLSLHIADYENSTEAAASDFFDDENIKGLKRQKFGSIKTSKKCLTDILKSQNPFEFPTQQNGDQRIKPELMQFKASQLGSSQPSSAVSFSLNKYKLMGKWGLII